MILSFFSYGVWDLVEPMTRDRPHVPRTWQHGVLATEILRQSPASSSSFFFAIRVYLKNIFQEGQLKLIYYS